METVTWILFGVVALGLIFDYTNGFHDSANAIATSIGTRALTPTVALAMAAVLNVVGGLIFETRVANTMTQIVDQASASQELVLAALVGAIVWNLITWYYGIPSSSSHALIGGLVGAAMAATFSTHTVNWQNVTQKVILPTIASPIVGFTSAILVTTILYRMVHSSEDLMEKVLVRLIGFAILTGFITFILKVAVNDPIIYFMHFPKGQEPAWTAAIPWALAIPAGGVAGWIMNGVIGRGPADVNGRFRHLQTVSAGFMALEHGHNDAQKTMGIITLALIAGGRLTPADGVPLWVKVSCATVMGLGTFTGGKRIIKTMGMRLVKLEPIDGFAAETVAGSVIQVAGSYGFPISTTHAITASITGVGATKRLSGVHWGVTGQILTAWVLTLPAAAIMAALAYGALRLLPH